MATISVLLPVSASVDLAGLNRAHESITDQRMLPESVVVVTNQPLSDEVETAIEDLVEGDPRSRHLHVPETRGLGGALQAGLQDCSTDLVARMDADDVSLPERLGVEHEILTDTEVDVVGTQLAEFREDPERPDRVRRVPTTHEEIEKWMPWRCPLNHPTTMFDREAVLAAGGYREFPMMEDWDLWARCLANGLRFRNLERALVRARVEELVDRRGGLRYAHSEVRMTLELKRLGIASPRDTLRHLALRVPMRLLPARLRRAAYRKLAR